MMQVQRAECRVDEVQIRQPFPGVPLQPQPSPPLRHFLSQYRPGNRPHRKGARSERHREGHTGKNF